MNESTRKVKGRIQAVRQWLNQAEEHFGRNASARAEIDLLLAEAELRSTRETLRPGHRWLTMNWVHQGIAFSLAAVFAAAGMGGAWWWWRDARTAALPATVVVAEAPLPPAPVQKITAAPNQKPEPAPAAAVETTRAGQEVNDADRPAKRETAVSSEEMKRLIQAAGQSLRGRTTP
jgi:hypothetical protein